MLDLRDQHLAEMQRRAQARERSITEIVKRYARARRGDSPSTDARLDRREQHELASAYERYALESFVVWATKNRNLITYNEVTHSMQHVHQEDAAISLYARQALTRRH